MQISFNLKELDVAEATLVLGMVLSRLAKICQVRGDTKAEVVASIAEVTEGIWDGISQTDKEV